MAMGVPHKGLTHPEKGNSSAIKLIVFTLTPTTTQRPHRIGARRLHPFDLNTVFGSLSVTNKFPFFERRQRYRTFLDVVVAYCLFSFPIFNIAACHTENIERHIALGYSAFRWGKH